MTATIQTLDYDPYFDNPETRGGDEMTRLLSAPTANPAGGKDIMQALIGMMTQPPPGAGGAPHSAAGPSGGADASGAIGAVGSAAGGIASAAAAAKKSPSNPSPAKTDTQKMPDLLPYDPKAPAKTPTAGDNGLLNPYETKTAPASPAPAASIPTNSSTIV